MTFFGTAALNTSLAPALASTNALQMQSVNILSNLGLDIPPQQAIGSLRTIMSPIVEDEPSLTRLELSSAAESAARVFTGSVDSLPSPQLLQELNEDKRIEVLKEFVPASSGSTTSPQSVLKGVERLEEVTAQLRESAEARMAAGSGSEALSDEARVLAAFEKAGLDLDVKELRHLRNALKIVLSDEVLDDFPSPVAEALRSLRGDARFTEEHQALLEETPQELLGVHSESKAVGAVEQVTTLNPTQLDLLAREAPTILKIRQITASEKHSKNAIARAASEARRLTAGAAHREGSIEALTLSKIRSNPEAYRDEPVEMVIFDYDGTLRRRRGLVVRHGQLWAEWLLLDVVPHPRHSVGVSLIKTLAVVIPGLINGVIEKVKGEADKDSTQRIIAKALEIGDPYKFEDSFERFIKYYGDMGHSAFVMEELRKHIAAGRLVIISSASPEKLVAGVLAKYGVPAENVQGTWFGVRETEEGNKELTGEFHWNHDESKIDLLEERLFEPLKELGVEYRIAGVYTDSPSDHPLVKLAVRGEEPGIVYTTNCSKRDFENKVLTTYNGVNVSERSGVIGFLLGGAKGTVTIRMSRQGDRETVVTDTYREGWAPYLSDWGRAIAGHGVPTGLSYYGGAVAADAVVTALADKPLNVLELIGNSGSIAMGTSAAIASMFLSAGLVRDGSSPFMRRVWVQRVLPLMIGAHYAGMEAPEIATYPMVGLLLGTALFAFQGLRWGLDIGGLVASNSQQKKALPATAASQTQDESGTDQSAEGDSDIVATENASSGTSALRAMAKVGIPVATTGLLGGAFYAVGSPEFGTFLVSALAISMATEGLATASREGARAFGLGETDEKRSWWSGLLGRGASTTLQLTAFRVAEFFSRLI